jgi:DnaK suppressor protein
MNKTNLEGCRRMLEAKRAQILSTHHDTEAIAIERVPDSMDEFGLDVERSMAVDALDRKTALFRQVTEALERIAGGKYGVCLACQERISPKRLAALPWAALCFECQQATENRVVADTKPSARPRLGYSLSDHGEPLAEVSRGRGHRLPRPALPRASTARGAIKSEAQL